MGSWWLPSMTAQLTYTRILEIIGSLFLHSMNERTHLKLSQARIALCFQDCRRQHERGKPQWCSLRPRTRWGKKTPSQCNLLRWLLRKQIVVNSYLTEAARTTHWIYAIRLHNSQMPSVSRSTDEGNSKNESRKWSDGPRFVIQCKKLFLPVHCPSTFAVNPPSGALSPEGPKRDPNRLSLGEEQNHPVNNKPSTIPRNLQQHQEGRTC